MRQFAGLKTKKKKKRKEEINKYDEFDLKGSKASAWEGVRALGHAPVLRLGSRFGYSLCY